MKVDIHITTCHHSTVNCRPRVREYPWSNVKPWTKTERLDISKVSVNSIINFTEDTSIIRRVTLIDDGSDMPEAITWLKSQDRLTVLAGAHKGSSAGINNYMTGQEHNDDDLIVHIEDDHISFNPFKIDWAQQCYNILTSKEAEKNKIAVITFRSGLPTNIDIPGYYGAWGPKGWLTTDLVKAPWFSALGNAHHIMLWKDYKKFLPLSGSSGSCENSMNIQLSRLGLKNIELQDHIYMFHSHMWEYPISLGANTNDWNLSGAGKEYGIYNMDKYLREKKEIACCTLLETTTIKEDYHYD